MFFFLLSMILRGIRYSSVERSATKVPKKRKKATKRHQDTVRWVSHYTNQARKKHSWSLLPDTWPWNPPHKSIVTGWSKRGFVATLEAEAQTHTSA